MKTLKLTAVALALATMSGVAMAEADLDLDAALKLSLIADVTGTADFMVNTSVNSDTSVSVHAVGVGVAGGALVAGTTAADAKVDPVQKSIDNNSLIVGTSASGVNLSGIGVLGNMGLNDAAGNGNQQSNSLAIATTNSGATVGGITIQLPPLPPINLGVPAVGVASADVTYEQNSELNDTLVFSLVPVLPSTASGVNGSVIGFAGNGGVNSAAGVGNQQGNYTAIASVNHGALAVANTGGLQLSDHNDTLQGVFLDNLSGINASVIAVAGNIGVNSAAGIGNQQVNTLSIASAYQ
ncbi:hypothetical protein [Jeongeupia chitinilytica]|uniref:Uncharacterized protein n=1 Tax=Jeongeupia chitinilytica TaxID=1041641 RepID=A0ABQ3H232_9NEIS|nr:hypothetical protein [Jeongeupia chitinilytica]GHD66415.1 hypothetical protein GCM10007350_28600 [Jeongeupia chitinilytica]